MQRQGAARALSDRRRSLFIAHRRSGINRPAPTRSTTPSRKFYADKFAADRAGDRRHRRRLAAARRRNPAGARRRPALRRSRQEARRLQEPSPATPSTPRPAPRSTASTGMRKVRLNNGVRRALEAAIGALSVGNPDPQRRIDAARGLYDNPNPASLAVVDAQLAKETDAAAKTALEQARAAILAVSPPPGVEDRLRAIAVLGDSAAAIRRRTTSPSSRRRADDRRRRQGGRRGDRRHQPLAVAVGLRAERLVRACRPPRCCCSPPSGSRSPSASWASSTWRMARW